MTGAHIFIVFVMDLLISNFDPYVMTRMSVGVLRILLAVVYISDFDSIHKCVHLN